MTIVSIVKIVMIAIHCSHISFYTFEVVNQNAVPGRNDGTGVVAHGPVRPDEKTVRMILPGNECNLRTCASFYHM